MSQNLMWNVGKFTYQQGLDKPIHFMELKDFILNDSLDFSHLFYVRSLRVKTIESDMKDAGLMNWIEGCAFRFIAETLYDLWEHKLFDNPQVHITEISPGSGMTFEYLKYLRESKSNSFDMHYKAWGPEKYQLKFDVLHVRDDYAFDYVAVEHIKPLSKEVTQDTDILIVNHDQWLQSDEGGECDVLNCLQEVEKPTLMAVRVTIAEESEVATTVRGKEVILPSLPRVLELCGQKDSDSCYRYFSHFDKNFFLPSGGSEIGLLLLYTVGQSIQLPQFNHCLSYERKSCLK